MNSPPADQQFPAELLQLQKSELFQWNLSNVGLNVALRFTMVFTVFAATQHTTENRNIQGLRSLLAVSIAGFSSSPLDAMSGMHEGDVLGRRALRSLDPCFYRLLAHHNTTSMGGRLLRSSLLPCSPIRTPPVKVPKKLPLNTSYAVSIHQ